MQSLQKLKKDLELNQELTQLLDILKGIAASRFRALEQQKKERFARFMDEFEGFFQMIDCSLVEHPFAQDKTGKLAIIIITSDEGFMGGLNTRVINTALGCPGAQEAQLIIIGERGAGYLRGLGRDFIGFPGVPSEERYETAVKLKDFIMKKALAGKFSRLMLVYPKSISFTIQKVEVLMILPCSELFKRQKTEGRSQMTEGRKNLTSFISSLVSESRGEVIIESSLGGIVEYLLGAWITQKLLEVIEDSKLSEFSARTIHLEESHQVLLQRQKMIQFQYFRSQHELVDKGMREIFAAQFICRK